MPRPHWHTRLKIVRSVPLTVDGFDTSRFTPGNVYDVNAPLCDLLKAHGYAEPADTSGLRDAAAAAGGASVARDEADLKRSAQKRRTSRARSKG